MNQISVHNRQVGDHFTLAAVLSMIEFGDGVYDVWKAAKEGREEGRVHGVPD